jgi:hypothetical protein
MVFQRSLAKAHGNKAGETNKAVEAIKQADN